MGIAETIKKNEKIHRAGKEIKYLFCESKGSDKLIVTFPGFTGPGSFEYRYVRTLKDVNAHRLFVLDNFGFRGCYLLGENRDFSVETAVISLINNFIKTYNIKLENIILHGSSKGGWMALYFGIKYRFGHVIAGGPQTKIGDFLIRHEFDHSLLKVADFIAGGHEEKDMNYLDSLLFDLLYYSPDNFPNIYIHIGKGDSHYQKHVEPFITELDKMNIKYQLDVQEYNEHLDLMYYYPEYLLDKLNSIDSKIIDSDRYRCYEEIDLDEYHKTDDMKIWIDRITGLFGSTISFKGWAFMNEENCSDYERFLIIKTDTHLEKYKVINESRPDVTKAFDNNPKYLYSGFICRINRNSLKDNFKIGMLFKSEKGEYYNEFNRVFDLKDSQNFINI